MCLGVTYLKILGQVGLNFYFTFFYHHFFFYTKSIWNTEAKPSQITLNSTEDANLLLFNRQIQEAVGPKET